MNRTLHCGMVWTFVQFCLAGVNIFAQSACEINDVHTNPDPKYVRPAAGSGAPAHWTNHFDWTRSWWEIDWPDRGTDFNNPSPPSGVTYKHIGSPFHFRVGGVRHLLHQDSSDFHPRDGWELVSMDFGMANIEVPSSRPGSFMEPHLFLYNKHTSMVRALFTSIDDDDAEYTAVQFMLKPRNEDNASGLFAGTGGLLNPLDRKSPTRTVITRVPAKDLAYNWNHIDVPVFYDPCSCKQDQLLSTKYRSITSGSIELYGLYAGTVITFDPASGAESKLYPKDKFRNPEAYLSSLDGQDELGLRPGATTAKNMDALADHYTQWVRGLKNPSPDLIGTIAFLGLEGIGVMGDVLQFVGSVCKASPKCEAAKAWGKVMSSGSKFASSMLKAVKPKQEAPVNRDAYLPMYTQGEMTLRGSLTMDKPLDGVAQEIALPGTPWTKDATAVHPFTDTGKPQYPLYNETLGLFAILHAPKVKVSTGSSEVVNTTPNEEPGILKEKALRHKWRQYKFDGKLDYVWNPASHVDIENTRINAMLIVEQRRAEAPDFPGNGCSDYYDKSVTNGERMFDTDLDSDGTPTSSVYFSEIVGLECLEEMPMTIARGQLCPKVNSANNVGNFRASDTIYVRLIMDVRFKPNEYGESNRSMMIYTLPVDIVAVDDTLTGSGIPTYAEDTLVTGQVVHNQSFSTFVLSTITFSDASLSTNPNSLTAEYVAGEEIVVRGESVIGQDTRLAIDLGVPCGKPRIAPYSGDINAFCTSSQYKAKELADAVVAGDEPTDPLEKWSKEYQLRARLETGQQWLDVVSEATEDPMVVVQVYDVIGNLVATGQGYKSAEPLTRTTVLMNGIPAGAYVVIATSGGKRASIKILYAP